MATPFIDFRPAEVRKNKETYILYYVLDPASDKLKRMRIRCNRVKRPRERLKYANLICAEINRKLYNGWNPLIGEEATPTKRASIVQDHHCHFFRIFAPSKPPPMSRCQLYRLVHPLRGCVNTRGNAIGYRYASPDGDGFPMTYSVTHSHTDHSSLITVHSSHTFSAKEKDSETGFSYFGSRYYSSDLSIWLSVDPMSDKYPSLSPYVYCADNPIKLVDPNGEEIVIEWKGSQYRYEKDGTLTHIEGNELDERQLNRFVNKAKQSLNKINKTSEGERMISDLQESSTKYTIKAGLSGYEKKGQEPKTITWNFRGTRLPVKGTPLGEYNPTCDLAHELSHAFDANNNWTDCNIVGDLEKCEWVACYRENLIRKELGYEYRTHYIFYQGQDGHFLGGKGGTELLYDNKPFLPFDINTYEKR